MKLNMLSLLIALLIFRALSSMKMGDQRLIEAARHNNSTLVQELIQAGIDLNTQDNRSFTALMHAAQAGYVAVARTLIQAGAALEVKAYGNTALTLTRGIAQSTNGIKIAQSLIAAGAHVTRYWYLDSYSYLQLKADLEALFNYAKTPFTPHLWLRYESQRHFESMNIRLFSKHIQRGVPLDLADAQGNTVLHHAVLSHNRVLIALVLYLMVKYSCPTLIMDKNRAGYTALDSAVLKAPEWLLPAFFKLF